MSAMALSAPSSLLSVPACVSDQLAGSPPAKTRSLAAYIQYEHLCDVKLLT